MKTLILDLEQGLIRTKSDSKFPIDYDDWEFVPSVIPAIKRYAPTKVLVLSNQGGISAGHQVQSLFEKKLVTILDSLRSELSVEVNSLYSIGLSESDPYRLPNVGMLHYAERTFDFVPTNCTVVGLFLWDYQFAQNAKLPFMRIDEFISYYS